MSWNPGAPECVYGIQWFPKSEPTRRVAGDIDLLGSVLHSTVTETIDSVWLALGTFTPFGSAIRKTGAFVEIYDASNLGVASKLRSVFRPAADAHNYQAYGWGQVLSPSISPPTQTDLYRFVNNATRTAGTWPSGVSVDDNTLIFPTFGRACTYGATYSGLSGTFTGKRILSVELHLNVAEYVDLAFVSAAGFKPFLQIGGAGTFFGPTKTVSSRDGSVDVVATFHRNPRTGCPWFVSELEDFETGGTSYTGVTILSTGSSNNLGVIQQMWLEVVYEDVETREAIGCISPIGLTAGWNEATLLQPDGTPSWSKAASTDYLFTVGSGKALGLSASANYVDVRYLLGDEAPPHVWSFAEVSLRSRTLRPDSYSEEGNGGLSILLEDNGGAISEDSQPYMSVNNDIAEGEQNYWTRVNSGQTLQQEFTPTANDDLSWFRLLVRQEDVDVEASLTIAVRRRSDSSLISSLESITSDDLLPPRFGPPGWQVVEGEFATPASVVSATQYYVEIASAATQGQAWEVQVLSALLVGDDGGPPAGVEDALFGNGTDQATVDGTEYDELTVAVTVHTQSDGPSNVTAVEVEDDTCLSHVLIGWTPPTLPAECAFALTEIERYDARSGEWERIAEITDESVDQFTDYEFRRGVETTYRIRVRREDGSPSEWTEATPLTVEMDCCGYVFASNAAPELAVWADDAVDGTREYEFPENVELLELSGRNYAVEFHELEFRGTRFSTVLILASEGGVNGTEPTTTPGVRVFEAILEKFRPSLGATLPYITVTTKDGDRWFASVKTPRGTRLELEGTYLQVVDVVETTDVPYVVDAVAGS